MCETHDTGALRDRSSTRDTVLRPGTAIGRFLSSEDGNMAFVAIIGAVTFFMMGGIGIDLMHAELKRNKVQNTLDSAVLAAANLDQQLDPEAVVRDYFDKMKMPEALTSVTVEEGLNFRKVSGTAVETMPSNFTRFLGVETLDANGAAAAEEFIRNVEISMVLDISGSMAYGNKMQELQDAAKIFVDTVLAADNGGLVSISIVPYSEHVNAGPVIAGELNVNWKHGYSHCLEFPDSEFTSTVLDTTLTYEQVQHYQWNYYGLNEVIDTICPQYSYERIQAFSNDANKLKKQIDDFEPRAGTSIFMGMKWGTALLDPSTRGINDAVRAAGGGNANFAGRPLDYGREDTIKTVVLMTDGQHDKSFRLSNWTYNSASEVTHWAQNNLWYYLQRNVHSSNWKAFYYQKYDAALGDALLDDICDAAKAQEIVVWSVGFEVTAHGSAVMQNCASSPAHYFEVEGTQIEDAFFAIARAINQLRLTL